MGRDDPEFGFGPKLFCDLTQSWSEVGGGVRTYLLHKRRHILESTPHRHLMIIPGARDDVIEEERSVTVTIKSPRVPASPHYRLLLRSGAANLRSLGIDNVDVVPLGVEVGEFGPDRRDPKLRARLGVADGQPLLIYVGRLDGEKKPDVVVDAFRRLPAGLGARLALIGEG